MKDSAKKSAGKEETDDHDDITECSPPDHGRNGQRLSVSTPDLVTPHALSKADATSEKHKGGATSRKLTALHNHIVGKWGSLKHSKAHNNNDKRKRSKSAQSENNVSSAVPHHDLEFPETTELISTKLHEKNGSAGGSCSRFKPIYQDWKMLRRGMKYQSPVQEFSLYWVVLSVSPNKRFKLKLFTNPENRLLYIHWDTQIGIITYFDGIRTYKVECMTTVERRDIWCITTGSQSLEVSCNFETVAQWQLPSEHKFCVVQPARFAGKYLLTQKDGLPARKSYPMSTLLGGHISLIELSTVCRTNSSSAEDIAPEDGDSLRRDSLHDHTTNNVRTMHGIVTDDQAADSASARPVTTATVTTATAAVISAFNEKGEKCALSGYSANGTRIEDYDAENSETNSDMVKVKQLSIDLISLISQLEADFRVNDNSFKQKIKSLDCLSRSMVQTLKTMQKESRDSRAEFKRKEAEQLSYTVALEERIAMLEDALNCSDYGSLSEGFTDVIRQYLDTDGFDTTTQIPTKKSPHLREQMEELNTEMNEKLKSLNKRIKSDQSSMVKEMIFIKDTVEDFRETTQQVLRELEFGVNSRIEHGNTLAADHQDLQDECNERFLRVCQQLSAFELKMNSLGSAVEEVELKRFTHSELSKTAQYETIGNLSDSTLTGEASSSSGSSSLPVIQEDSRLEDLEQTCRALMDQLQKQQEDIEVLKDENHEMRSQFNELYIESGSPDINEEKPLDEHTESITPELP